MKAKPKSETVKVAVRVRPMNNREKEEKSIQCVEVDREQNQVSVSDTKHETKTFQFDYVYDMNSTQREVYDQVAFPIVDSIFQGYNGTIFAYGQTGCGKTFTMMGVVNDPVLKGVVPNAFDHIFGYINAEGSSKKFLIRCSFVEIYNEEVRDWWGTPTKALEVREDPKKGTYVKGLSFTPWANTKEIEKCLDRGNNNRHVGVTSMNDQSSRSHSLFTVYVEIEEGIDDKNKKIRSGKLNLVDLAGSERVGKTNATGQTFDEGKKINLSLTAWGSVIDAWAANRKHIPYKDSKLTRWWSDSLGGNTKTVMFANCSPASFNYEETVGTLRYASRAKLIKNAPKINEDPKDAWWRQYEEQIKMWKEQLEGKLAPPNEDRFKEAEEEEDNADRKEEKPKVQRKQSNIENWDPAEKRALLEKIAAWEKEMISGGTKGNTDEGKKEIRKDEQDKFKQYRLQQLKNVDEMEKKLAWLEETKRKEEESWQNDVTKLKKRIKYWNTEIEDWKYDNEKDRTDFLENIKGYNKDIKWYRGIIGYLLTDWELRKIIDMSSYNDETETWKIHPFTIREKTLQLPNVKPSQVPVLIEGEINSREWLWHDQPADERPNRFNDNYSNYRDNRDNKDNKKHKYKINEDVGLLNTNKNNYNQPSSFECNGNKYPNNNINNNINIHNNQNQALSKQMRAREKVWIDGSKHNITTKRQSNNNLMKSSEDRESVHSNNSSNSKVSNWYNPPIIHSNTSNTTNINMWILNKKERERFEELMKYGNSNMSNVNSSLQGNGATNANTMGTWKPLKKGGKYILDPIKPNQLGSNPNNNGKLEWSFKATLEISDNSGNKIEISPNVNWKRKYKLDRINEGNES